MSEHFFESDQIYSSFMQESIAGMNHMMYYDNYQIIKGIVVNEKGKPSPGAVIELLECDLNGTCNKLLGYTIADKSGQYAIALNACPYKYYELKVYSSMIK